MAAFGPVRFKNGAKASIDRPHGLDDKPEVLPVSIAAGLGHREDALVDAVGLIEGAAFSHERRLNVSDRNMCSGRDSRRAVIAADDGR